MEVIPSRDLNLLYILLDIGFLLILAGALLWCRKYLAALFGLFGGLLYFLVDYGGFYLLLGTREVSGADPFWFLLWLSMSYGFTNFVWIWLWLDRDGHALEWSVLIVAGWLAVALLAGLAAKESVVACLAMFYGTGISGAFLSANAAYSFLVFVLLYVPCAAATATMNKELGGCRWALISIVWQLVCAYLVSFIVYQVGRLF